MVESQKAVYNIAEWYGKMILDVEGQSIGKLEEVYVDVETDEPQFATVKEGFFGRHLTFVPLAEVQVSPDSIQVAVSKDLVKDGPNLDLHGEELTQEDEKALYAHFNLKYTVTKIKSGRRLARR